MNGQILGNFLMFVAAFLYCFRIGKDFEVMSDVQAVEASRIKDLELRIEELEKRL